MEEAESFRFVNHLQTACFAAFFVKFDNTVYYDIEVRLSVHTTRDSKTYGFELRFVFVSGYFVATGRDDTAFHRTNATLNIEVGSQSLCYVMFLRNIRVESLSIDKYAVSADRMDYG